MGTNASPDNVIVVLRLRRHVHDDGAIIITGSIHSIYHAPVAQTWGRGAAGNFYFATRFPHAGPLPRFNPWIRGDHR